MATNNKYALAIKARQDADKRQGTLPKTTNKYALGVYYNAPVADHRPSPVMRLETSVDSVMPKITAPKPTVSFGDVRQQTAVRNASSRLFQMDNSLMGQAISNANAVTKQLQQQRSEEIQRKISEVQQQRAKELQAKIAELRHQQDVYFDADREQQLKDANRQLANTGGALPKTTLLGDTVGKGAGMFNQGAASFADFMSNALPRIEGAIMGVEPEATFTGQLLKPATKATGAVKDYVDTTVAKIDENAAEKIGENKVLQQAYNLGSGTVAALPQAVLAMMTAGGSAATQIPAQSNGLLSTVTNAASKAMSKPATKLAFAQSLGGGFEEAKAQGASDMEAMVSSTLSSFVNAIVESSGGIDELPGEIRDLDLTTPQKAWRWVSSMLDEGKEEVVQNVITKLTNKGIFAEDTPLFSTTDENAVVNPKRMAGEFAMGTAIGGILGGGQMLTQSVIDSIMPRLPQQQLASPQSAQDVAIGDIVNMVAAENNAAQEQNKSAPANEARAESTAVNTNPATHTPQEQKVIKEYQNAVDEDLVRFVQQIQDGSVDANKVRYVLKPVSDRAALDIQRITGVDTSGFSTVFEGRMFRHIMYRHGANGKADHSMRDLNDVGRMQYVMDNYDSVSDGGTTKAYTTNSPNGKPGLAKTVVFEKAVNGTYYVVEAVPDTKAKTTYVVSAYMSKDGAQKNGAEQLTDATSAPVLTAETGFAQTPNSNIATPPENVNGEIGNMGAKTSEFPHEVKESQSKTTPAYHEQYNIPEEGRADNHYTSVTEAESLHNARLRLEQDYEGEVAEMRAKTTWSNEEMDMGQMVLDDLRVKAEETGDWSEFREWDKVNREHKSEAGRALQALAKQNRNTATDIMSNASEALENAKDGTDTNDVMNTVSDYATRYEVAAETKNIDGLMQIIHDTSVTRKTGTRKGGLSKEIDWALKRIADYARAELANAKQTDAADVGKFYDFLQNFAANGIEAIATDKQKTSLGEAYLTIRRNSMLSKAATVMRNLVGNNVFDPLDSMANNMAVPLDMLISKATGTRSVAVDKSWISEAKRKGSMDGLAMALLEVGLDVNSDSAASKYENAGTRTFHMANGGFSKLMSTWEKYMGYVLSATDEFQKGGIAAETQRGIDKLYEQGKIKDDTLRDAGEQEALYRTFQDENAVSGLVQDIRRAANNRFSRGGVGVGDLLVPFAQVPSTLPVRAAEYSPIGLASGIGKMAKVLRDAKKGTLTAAQQASAVKDIGRGLTGSAMIAAAAALAAKGIIHVVAPGGEEENKDKAASEKAQGLNGTQWNLDATIRAIKGESAEWQDGDTIMSIAFLDPINAQLTTGALIAEDIANDKATFGRILKDSFSGALQSFLDLPVMQTGRQFADALRYSDGETPGDKLIDAATQWAAGEVTSVIPNALKGIAQGTDEYQRDLYAKDDVVGQVVDNIVGSIPGLRQKFTTKKQDVYGNDVKNPDQPLNFLNANILPGAITTYSETDLQAALNALAEETGVNSMYLSKNPPKSISVDGTKVELTDEQQRQFMTDRGEQYESASAALEADETYKDFSGEWKLKAYECAEDYATQKAKEGLEAGFKPDTWVSDLEGATPEEFSEALVQRVVENMAGKAGENKYLGLENLLDNGSIDDQLALACMSESANEAYTNICKDAGISVQQFLDAYGNAHAGGENAYERKQAALNYIDTLDLDAKTASKLALGVHTAIGTTVKMETEVPEDYLLSIGAIEQFEAQMSKTQKEDYDKYIKGSGVNLDLYQKTWDFSNSEESKGEKDKDGKDIKGKTHRDKVIDYIAGLNCSEDDKDAIFLALGYSKKNLPRTWK